VRPRGDLIAAVARELADQIGDHLRLKGHKRIAGGDINEAFRLDFDTRLVFLKCKVDGSPKLFECEALGLKELADSGTLLTPKPLAHGLFDNVAWLAMDYLSLIGSKLSGATVMGKQLARLHRKKQPYFGWRCDNFIGLTPQPNSASDQWLPFYAENRLRFQVERLIDAGGPKSLSTLCNSMIDRLPEWFEGHIVHPSLVHGDLWGGNWGVTADGQPTFFDPACHYADRETDLAMSELFGGFPSAFYQAYEESFPLSPGYRQRKPLYQLYHVLNHANLFGGGYLSRAQQMMQDLVINRNRHP
jgi:fructosamine-3-kinase